MSLLPRKSEWINRRSSRASAEYRPCFNLACLILSTPSGVLGPVLLPPCILHLPFAIPQFLQGIPALVFAPHWFAWGVCLVFATIPPSPRLRVDNAYHGLAPGVHLDVFHRYLLLSLGSILV